VSGKPPNQAGSPKGDTLMLLWKSVIRTAQRSRLSTYRPRLELLEARTLLSFITAPDYVAGSAPWSVATGDWGGDGVLGLAVADFGSNSVSVLLGQGNGAVQAPRIYPVGLLPEAVAVGDFNGDGLPDIVVANYGSNTVSVLLNKGGGNFRS